MRCAAAGLRALRMLASLAVVAGVQACASPPTPALSIDEPEFGQSVRAALRAQELPPVKAPATPEGLSYSELEHGLNRYKAPPPGGAAASGTGAGAARSMLQ